MKLRAHIVALHAAFLAVLLACSPAGSGSLTLLGAGKPTAAAGGCAESTAYLARKSGTTNNAAYTTYICGLVTDGVWAKLEALYIFAGDTQANSLLNLKSATYNATIVGTVTFTAGGSGTGGFSGAVGPSYVDSNFIPSTSGSSIYLQNSASLVVWSNVATSTGGTPLAGEGPPPVTSDFLFANSSAFSFASLNGGNSGFACATSVGASGGLGLFEVTRTGSNNTDIYKNGGSPLTSCTGASVALSTSSMVFLTGQGGNYSSVGNVAAGAVGGALNSTDSNNLYLRTHALLQAIAGYP